MNERNESIDSVNASLAWAFFLITLLVLSLMNVGKVWGEYTTVVESVVEAILKYGGLLSFVIGGIYILLNKVKSGFVYSTCGLIYIVSAIVV